MTAQTLHRPATLDLSDRGVLLRSWLHTLHGPGLDPRPVTTGPLPPMRALVGNAVAWHVAYAVVALIGVLLVARGGSGSVVAEALAEGGRVGLAIGTVVLWWGGALLSTALWWAGVQAARRS